MRTPPPRPLLALILTLTLAACAPPESSPEPNISMSPAASAAPSSSAESPAPSEVACPDPPFTFGEVAAVPVADRPACFGSQDITLVGWVFQDLDPVYDCVTYPDRPMWLMCILDRQPLLAAERPPGAWDATLQPLWVASDPDGPVGPIRFGATDGPVAVNTWVEVTGHFDDPAAADCGPDGDGFREECAGTLALTAARAADAPRYGIEVFPDPDDCQHPDGYRVAYPDAWYSNSAVPLLDASGQPTGEGIPACEYFAPTDFSIAYGTDVPPYIAIFFRIHDLPEGTSWDFGPRDGLRILSDAEITVDGLPARVQEIEVTSRELAFGPGDRYTQYVVEMPPDRYLAAQTYSQDGYESSRDVLAQMMLTLDIYAH